MIIPDGHDNTTKVTRKKTRVAAVGSDRFISNDYQKKVDEMLDKMEIGTSVRIERICRPENSSMFIQAIKNHLILRADDAIRLNEDTKEFSRWETKDERAARVATVTRRGGSPIKRDNREAIARRNSLFRYWRKRMKSGSVPPFCHNAAEYADDGNAAIDNQLNTLKHAIVGSLSFDITITRIESIAASMQQHDGDERTFNDYGRRTLFDVHFETAPMQNKPPESEPIFEITSRTIRVTEFHLSGDVYANITPDSIHKTIETPKGFKDDDDRVWVRGMGVPVRLETDEFEFVTP